MIRKSIEKGTEIWHNKYGDGIFHFWSNGIGTCAVVEFYDDKFSRTISAKDLTEIEQLASISIPVP